jgi:hypothetical protein
MRTYDVEFQLNSGIYKGETYGFTLARKNGKKAWDVQYRYDHPPSLIKHAITMGITAREDNINAAGIIERERMDKIIEKIERISDEITPVTLKGLDGRYYNVIIDKNGLKEENTMHEKERMPEFILNVLAWSLHD